MAMAEMIVPRSTANPSLSPTAKHFFWIILLAIGFSFPVGAVFEGAIEVPISVYVIPAVVTLPVIGLVCLSRMENRARWALLLTFAATAIFNVAALLFIDRDSYMFKVWFYWVTLAMFGIVTACVLQDRKVVPVFSSVLVGLGGFSLALLLLFGDFYDIGRASVEGSNPIWMARLVGLLGVGCFAVIVERPERLFFGAAGIAASLFGMSLTGSRGPIIGLLIAITYGAVVFDYKNKHRVLIVAAVGAGLTAMFILGWNLLGSSRVLDFSGNSDTSASLRSDTLDYAFDMIRVEPGGLGVGNFDFMYVTYPHNIYVEYVVEWGWIIGAAFNLTILSGSVGLLRMGPAYNALKLLLLYELINAGFSGDITSPRFLYGLILIGNGWLLMQWLDKRSKAGRAGSLAIA